MNSRRHFRANGGREGGGEGEGEGEAPNLKRSRKRGITDARTADRLFLTSAGRSQSLSELDLQKGPDGHRFATMGTTRREPQGEIRWTE